ncbi:hypothetical protein B566_EDAN004799 [Ephemera danica]|nr:hypothetical protein B566_EDAN004799 [Ephemera danica]
MVVAQLYTKRKCHGVHFFIVPVRDEKTHMPLPGISVGEIGRKMGMNSTNNGFLAFNKVRIPRSYMLMKNSQVLQDGTYVKPPSSKSKLVYGTLMHVRVSLVENLRFFLAKAVTIAIRYSAVRRQSELIPGAGEPQILDYQTQQYKLLPYLAFTYAFRFSSQRIMELYEKFIGNVEKGDVSLLPELHALSCCLKAVSAFDVATGVETVRLACGGHGYMTCSDLPITYGLATAGITYEGENTVMLLQTARALIKAYNGAKNSKFMSPIMSYLTCSEWGQRVRFIDLEGIVQGFKQVAAAKVGRCGELLQRGTASGLAPEMAWNAASVQLVEAAEAHCRAFLVERYVEALRTRMSGLSPELRAVMQQLCQLYCVFWTLRKRGDFLQYTSMRPSDVSALEDWQSRLLAALRPNAVGLVDSFDYRDEILGSALGAWDGQVYQRLLANAMKSPLNAKPVHDSFHASIAPMLKAKY